MPATRGGSGNPPAGGNPGGPGGPSSPTGGGGQQPPQQPPQQGLVNQLQALTAQLAAQNQVIAQLQQQVQQQQQAAANPPAGNPPAVNPPANPPRFAVSPAEHRVGILDFDNEADSYIYKESSKSLYQDPADRCTLDPEHTQAFMNKVYDRGVACNLSTLMVPEQANDMNSNKISYVQNHAQFTEQHLRNCANIFIGQKVRAAQDDKILCTVLQNSLSEDAHRTISNNGTK